MIVNVFLFIGMIIYIYSIGSGIISINKMFLESKMSKDEFKKAIKSNEEIKKGYRKHIKKIIFGHIVIIFFVIIVVLFRLLGNTPN